MDYIKVGINMLALAFNLSILHCLGYSIRSSWREKYELFKDHVIFTMVMLVILSLSVLNIIMIVVELKK